MKYYVFKLLIFAAMFLVFDKLFLIVRHYSAEKEIDKRLEYLIKGKINKDVIIAGSSRGSRDLIAGQIEEQLGVSSYNLCYPGSSVEFHAFIIRTLVKFNELPRIIFLVVDDPEELVFNDNIKFRKDRLYPLVKYPYVLDALVDSGDKDRLLSNIFVLHQLNKYNFDLRQKEFTSLDSIMECGSMPISWQSGNRNWSYPTTERAYKIENEEQVKITAYKKIVELCESLCIKLVIVFPPNYQPHSKEFEDRLRQLSGDTVDFYIYNTKNPIYKNKDYFYDQAHLMRNGAVEFTNELIIFLRKYNFASSPE